MEISLNNVGRRFNKEWIFKGINYQFVGGENYAVLGPNGSGKSTLLSIIIGSLTPSEGEISYLEGKTIDIEDVYQKLSFAAPYLDLVEEFTLTETIDFHFQFKEFAKDLNTEGVIQLLGLEKARDKALKYFSSGMKQRTKLALACCANTPILVLDEPTSNLDQQGIDWYRDLIENYAADKLVIVGSNQPHEYDFCSHHLQIGAYKS